MKLFLFCLSSVFGSSGLNFSFSSTKGLYLRFPFVVTKWLCFANSSSLPILAIG